jgi:hypothetical protein
MMPLSDMAEGNPEIMKALTDARVVLDMAEKSGSEQVKVDANNAADATVKASTQPAAAPAPTGAQAPTADNKPQPQGLTVWGKDGAAKGGPEQSATPAKNNVTVSNWKESIGESDNELARWLKIARG